MKTEIIHVHPAQKNVFVSLVSGECTMDLRSLAPTDVVAGLLAKTIPTE
jgi:hypothetical protein